MGTDGGDSSRNSCLPSSDVAGAGPLQGSNDLESIRLKCGGAMGERLPAHILPLNPPEDRRNALLAAKLGAHGYSSMSHLA